MLVSDASDAVKIFMSTFLARALGGWVFYVLGRMLLRFVLKTLYSPLSMLAYALLATGSLGAVPADKVVQLPGFNTTSFDVYSGKARCSPPAIVLFAPPPFGPSFTIIYRGLLPVVGIQVTSTSRVLSARTLSPV